MIMYAEKDMIHKVIQGCTGLEYDNDSNVIKYAE